MSARFGDAFDLVTSWDENGDARIRISGDLDWDTADLLTRAAGVCLGAEPAPQRLQLDCAGLTLCDSLGLAALLMIHRQAAGTGTLLHLAHPPAVLRRMLRTTGTSHVFADAATDVTDVTGAPDGPDVKGAGGER